MNLLPASSLFFYEFQCDDQLTDRILTDVKELKFVPNKSNLATHEDWFFDEELVSWFEKCVYQVKLDIGLSMKVQVPITSVWANKTSKLQAHHEHTHPNSFLSGVFYLTSHGDSPTYWTFPNP